MNLDYNALIEQISFSSKFIAITLVVGSLLKIALTNYFLWKIELSRQSRIVIKKDEKVFTSTRANESASYQIFKSLNEETPDGDIEKTWKNVS